MVQCNGAEQLVSQCQKCGKSSSFIPKAVAARFVGSLLSDVPYRDPSISDDFRAHERTASPELFASTLETTSAWRERYEAHLASDKWAFLRAKVLERAGGICEGCLAAPATAVHHLTYNHMGDELLWELVAVCDACPGPLPSAPERLRPPTRPMCSRRCTNTEPLINRRGAREMSVYHFENGKLVKIYDTLSQAIDEDRECNPEEGFASADFTMPGEVEDMASTLPVLDRDELNEYVDALRLMEPLLAPKTFLELESEIFHRIEEEVRREQAPDL